MGVDSMTPEDEAFDDLAKRQGDWGGGFPAKRQMAADKLQEDLINYGTAWSQDGKRIDPMSVYKEPAQESANYLRAVLNAYGPDAGISLDQNGWNKLHAAIKEAWVQPAQEPTGMLHIERLDKWLDASLKERKQREWVGLTDEDCKGMSAGDKVVAMWANRILKEKNA